MASSDDGQARREEARAALGGELLAAKAARVIKRRREALLAMEGEKHRARREGQETAKRLVSSEVKSRAEQQARTLAEGAANRAREQAERSRAETAALTAETERRGRIKRAEVTTARLRNAPVGLSPLRTIKTDMARAVRESGLSLAKIATMGPRANNPSAVDNERGPKLWLGLAIAVVIAGAGGLFWWWWQQLPNPATESGPSTPVPVAIFRTDGKRGLDAGGLKSVVLAREALETAATAANKNTGLFQIYFYRNGDTLPLRSFATLLGLALPDNLTRHLRDSFVFGFNDNGEVRQRFLLLQTSFVDQAWSAMLDWERYLPGDLAPLLKLDAPRQSTWQDRVTHNKDTRVLVDPAGNVILIYGFLDKENILIARDEKTFSAVFGRLIEQN